MNEMKGYSIFNNSHIDENEEEIGFSKNYLSKRIIGFYRLLKKFRNLNYGEDENILLLDMENELEDNLRILELNGRMNWLERNGYYGTFIMVQEGILTYGEWGQDIEDMLYKRYQSTVNKLES